MASLREALSAAIEKHEIEPVPDTDTPEEVETAPEPEEPVELEAAPEDVPAEEVAEEPAAKGDRDERGRFKREKQKEHARAQRQKPPVAAQGAQPEAGAQPEPAPQQEAAAAALRAPSSLKPAARELFGKLPAEFRPLAEDLVRVDQHVRQVMQESAGVRQFAESFTRTLAPYEHMIRAEQRGRPYNPMAAVEGLLSTAAALRTGTEQQRADIVTELVESYGVSIEALDRALSKKYGGKPADGAQPDPRPQARPEQFRDPRVDALFAERDQEQARRKQEVYDQGQRTIATFAADPKNEFFEDVKPDMARLIAAAAQAGEEMTLSDAYDTAIRLPKHAGIGKILQQREGAKAIEERKKRALQARRAATSVRPNPAGGSAPPGQGGRRGTIEAAWEETETR